MIQVDSLHPPASLVQQWKKKSNGNYALIASEAAQWGAQQERKLWLDAVNSRKQRLRQQSPIMQQLSNY